jgi:hypothetical protein
VSQLQDWLGGGPGGSHTAQIHRHVLASRTHPCFAVIPSGAHEQSHWQVVLFQLQVPSFCGIGPGSQTGQSYWQV